MRETAASDPKQTVDLLQSGHPIPPRSLIRLAAHTYFIEEAAGRAQRRLSALREEPIRGYHGQLLDHRKFKRCDPAFLELPVAALAFIHDAKTTLSQTQTRVKPSQFIAEAITYQLPGSRIETVAGRFVLPQTYRSVGLLTSQHH